MENAGDNKLNIFAYPDEIWTGKLSMHTGYWPDKKDGETTITAGLRKLMYKMLASISQPTLH